MDHLIYNLQQVSSKVFTFLFVMRCCPCLKRIQTLNFNQWTFPPGYSTFFISSNQITSSKCKIGSIECDYRVLPFKQIDSIRFGCSSRDNRAAARRRWRKIQRNCGDDASKVPMTTMTRARKADEIWLTACSARTAGISRPESPFLWTA